MGRYDNRNIFNNDTEQYKSKARDKGITSIRQYDSPKLKHPTVEQMRSLDYIEHTWRVGDRYWKLAELHYGDSELWWVIAWFNRTPMETDIELGAVVQIPVPLETVLSYMGL